MNNRKSLQGMIILGLIVSISACGTPPSTPTFASPAGATSHSQQSPPPTPTSDLTATQIAKATATTLAQPTLTPIRPLTDQTIHDPVNHFSLKLLPGWHAWVPSAGAVAGATVIFNFDETKVSDRLGTPLPPNGLKIQIGAGRLEPGQSFEQWLSDRIASETALPSGVIITATQPSPYDLGKYKGVTFVLTGYGPNVQEITLLNGGQIVDIGLAPADSPALAEALSMLSSIEISSTSRTVIPTPSQTTTALKYYWPALLPSSFKINPCASSADNTGFNVSFEEQKRKITIAGGSGVHWLSYLPPCSAEYRAVAVGEQQGCIAMDENTREARLFWQEGENVYVVQGNGLQVEEISNIAKSLESINRDIIQRRLAPLVTPTVTPSGPLVYFWPSKVPQGLSIDSQKSSADESGFTLELASRELGRVIWILGGSNAPRDESCNDRLRPATVRSQQGYVDLGTGAGFGVLWRVKGRPYIVGGMSMSLADGQALAESLEPLDLVAWKERLMLVR